MFTHIRKAVVAAAILGAGSAWAQTPRPAPAPANPTHAQPQTTQAQTGQSSELDPQAQQKLEQVRTMANNTVQVAQVAQKKAQSQQAKDLANNVVKDYQGVVSELDSLAKQRGLNLNTSSASSGDLQAVLNDLNGRTGPDFDRQFIQYETGGFEKIEQALKDLRDSTPGHDAQLKKWLDTTEDKAEASLAQARQTKSAVQARTPPAH